MRLLRINNIDIDIDEQTSIGIDIQAYDIKDSCKRKFNVSNNFTIPRTTKNLSVFEFGDNVNITDTSIYDRYTVDYWVDCYKIIDNGWCYVSESSERINIIITDKSEFWETIKNPNYNLKYLNDLYLVLKNIPNVLAPFSGTFSQLIDDILNDTYDIKLNLHFGNFLSINENLPFYYESQGITGLNNLSILISHTEYEKLNGDKFNVNGNHFSIKLIDYFKLIETVYNINFNTSIVFDGNLFQDDIFLRMSIPARTFGLTKNNGNYYFANQSIYAGAPNKDFSLFPFNIDISKDNSIFEFIQSVFKLFNVIIETVSTKEYKLYRFDSLLDNAEIVNFSGMFSGNPKFKPLVSGFAQNNFIKWSKVYKGGDSYLNSKNITCQNKNIDTTKDLFSITGFIPSLLPAYRDGSELILNYSTEEEAIKTMSFLIDSEVKTIDYVDINFHSYSGLETIQRKLNISAIYDINSEYNLINSMLQYPKFYEYKKWLSVPDILNFKFYQLYWIQELNATFFINKISGFNPDKSKDPVTLELIKVSETPALIPKAEIWVDGVGNPFVDGEENIFY